MASAAEQVLEVLEQWGIEYFFGCPGTTETPLLDALVDRQRPEFVLATHEVAAVNLADGYARATGRPGVVLLHTNVGLGNGLGQIQNAWACRVPLVVLGGMKPTGIQGRGCLTTAPDIRGMVDQFCKWAWVCARADAMAENVLRALKIASTPPHGVAFVGLPEDLQVASGAQRLPPVAGFQIRQRIRPDADGIREAAKILSSAQRPLLIFGDDVAKDEAFDEAVSLAESLGAPVLTETRSALAFAAFPTDHRQFLGTFTPSSPMVTQADAILMVGNRAFAEFQPSATPYLPPGVPVIHIHSDPWELAKIYPATVAMVADAKSALADLITALKQASAPDWRHVAGGRARAVSDLRARQLDEYERDVQAIWDAEPIRVDRVAAELARVVDEEVSIIAQAVTSTDALIRHVRLLHEQSYHSPGPGGGMPFAVGAAVGYKLGAPDRKVVCFVGDGVFLMGLQALTTAVAKQVPVAFVVINNNTYMAVKAGLLRYQGRAAATGIFPGTAIGGPDCAAIARGFGAAGRRVTRPAEIAPALAEALAHPGPFVLEVMCEPGDVGDIRRS